MNKHFFKYVIALFLFFIWSGAVSAASTPTITAVIPLSTSVGTYQKFEANISLSQTFTADSLTPYYYYDPTDTPTADPGRNSPYGVDGISIDAHFRSPSGKTFDVPVFYYQDYVRTGSYTTGSTLTPSPTYYWKVRFAPSEVGTYTYTLSVADTNGLTAFPSTGELTFTAVATPAKGFIRVSPKDQRFLSFSNGESFIPIASGRQWWVCCGKRSFDYEKTFADFAQNGINFTRIWDQNDSYGLTVEGRFDAYKYPDDFNPVDQGLDIFALRKGTQFNQRGNYEEDKIIESAEKNGVYIQLTSHGDPYWIWDGSVYDESWNTSPQAFDSVRHVNYWKRNFRYRVARWGYSTAIFGWETWNEHGHVAPGTALYNFYSKLSSFQLQTDPYKHIRTTSQGSQTFSPAFWSSGFFDVANYHNYMMGWFADDLKNDDANFVYRTAWCLRDIGITTASSSYCSGLGLGDSTTWAASWGQMPWVWGEIDVGTNNWNEPNPLTKNGEGRLRVIHNVTWAGLFSPLGTSPLDWYWDTEDAQTTAAKYVQKKAVAQYFKDIPYDAHDMSFSMSTPDAPPGYSGEKITVSNPTIRVYAMKSSNKQFVYGWVQNRNNTWSSAATPTAPVTGTVTFTNLNSTAYTAEIWDTYSGQITSTLVVEPVNGSLSLPVTNLTSDFAVKLKAVGATPPSTPPPSTPLPTSTPTPTPTPTPVPSSPTIGNGDVNGDKSIDLGDILALLTNWTKPVVTSTDQYLDGVINSLDFAVIATALGGASSPTPTATPTPSPTPANTPSPSPTASPTPTATPAPTTSPTPIPNPTSGSWTQFGGNAARTSHTTQTVATPWKYAWQWNGAGADGKPQSSHLAVADLVQPVTGGSRVYMVANNTVFALQGSSTDKTNGTVIWSKSGLGTIEASAAYANEFVYIASTTGLHKLNAATGAVENTFANGASFKLAPLLTDSMVVVPSTNGHLLALDKNSLSVIWDYAPASNSSAATPASYSSKKNLYVYLTSDLQVHTVNGSNGTAKWVRKPTIRTGGDPGTVNRTLAQAEAGWPVIAEEHGVVFVRYRLDWQTLWDGPVAGGTYPADNTSARKFLADNPSQQALFTLKLDDGADAFAAPPNAGNGGAGDGGYLPMGPQPVIRVVDGKEVAYMLFRSTSACPVGGWCDGREETTMGELVLDDTTIPGLTGGDIRYVQWSDDKNYTTPPSDPYYHDMQTDEMMYVTGSGNTLFHNHWLTSESYTITDRGNTLGLTYSQPIKTAHAPNIIWRQVYCSPTDSQCNPAIYPGGSGFNYGPSACQFDASTRYCQNGLYGYGDSRAYSPGFYEYHNSYNPQSGSSPFVVVSDGLVLVKSNDGAIIALTNGNPTTAQIIPPESINVLGAQTVSGAPEVAPAAVKDFIGQPVVVTGTVMSAVSHLPKAFYIGLTDKPEETFLVRVFAQDVDKFEYDLNTLVGKEVKISGTPSLYWPDGKIPELVVTDPEQITIIDGSPQNRFVRWVKKLFDRFDYAS